MILMMVILTSIVKVRIQIFSLFPSHFSLFHFFLFHSSSKPIRTNLLFLHRLFSNSFWWKNDRRTSDPWYKSWQVTCGSTVREWSIQFIFCLISQSRRLCQVFSSQIGMLRFVPLHTNYLSSENLINEIVISRKIIFTPSAIFWRNCWSALYKKISSAAIYYHFLFLVFFPCRIN